MNVGLPIAPVNMYYCIKAPHNEMQPNGRILSLALQCALCEALIKIYVHYINWDFQPPLLRCE